MKEIKSQQNTIESNEGNIEYVPIKDKKDLEILKDKSASYKDLNFTFSDEYIDKLSELLDAKNAIQLFAKDNEKFVGYIASAEIFEQYPNHSVIVELFIDPEFQGKGFGTKLIDQLIEESKQKDLDGIITQTEKENIPAQDIYKKQGFQEIDNPEWEEGITYQLKFLKDKKHTE